MTSPRFGIYGGPLSLNYGTPSQNQPVNGNSATTTAEIDAIIDSTIGQLLGTPGGYDVTEAFLWLFHFPDSNSPFVGRPNMLTYNGMPLAPTTTPGGELWELSPNLPSKLESLRNAGVNVLASIGGWEGSSNFATIKSIGVSQFVDQLENQLFQPFHVNGLNIDLEPGSPGTTWSSVYRDYGQTIVDLSNQLAAKGYVVTHTPASGLSTSFYLDSCPGLANSQPILQATYQGGVQAIKYLNVQYYAGGAPNPNCTGQMVTDFADQVISLGAISSQTGIANPEQFLMAGFAPEIEDPNYPVGDQPLAGTSLPCSNPSAQLIVLDALKSLAGKYPGGFGGSFDWIFAYYNSQQPGYTNQISAWQQMTSATDQSGERAAAVEEASSRMNCR